MVISPLALWLILTTPWVTVEGRTECPSPRDVADRVAALLPPPDPAGTPDIVRLESEGGAVRVRLQRPDGSLVGERMLERRLSCADRAAAVAIVVAAWESDVHPEFIPTLQSPPPPPPPPPAIVVVPPPPPPPARWSFDAGAALLGSLAPDDVTTHPAAAAMLAASATGPGGRLGGQLSLQLTSLRTLDLPHGQVRWRRLIVGAGPHLRLSSPSGRFLWDFQLDALAAWVGLRGAGFVVRDASAVGFDPGLGVGVRLLWRLGAVAPWVQAGGLGWLRRQVASEDPTGDARALPRLEAQLALGVSAFWGP